jgi:tripartite-type tricarboxylate transporter receptor subunit TctC
VPGANGSVGVGRIARADGDGYTLTLGLWNTHVANGALYQLQYDLVKDFEPVALISSGPAFFVASKTVPANDLRELVHLLKASPGKPSMATQRGLCSEPTDQNVRRCWESAARRCLI